MPTKNIFRLTEEFLDALQQSQSLAAPVTIRRGKAIVALGSQPSTPAVMTIWDDLVRGLRIRIGKRTSTWTYFRDLRRRGKRYVTCKKSAPTRR
jgi:hypothetical protein